MINAEMISVFCEPIFTYSRNDALADGILIDVTNEAKAAGFKIPVAVTRAVWDQYIEWAKEDDDKQTVQHQSGRLYDVLWMLFIACKRCRDEAELRFSLSVIPRDGQTKRAKKITLKSIIGAGDNGAPVITIMLPTED